MLIGNVILFAKEGNLTGLLLFLDFKKVIVTIEWPYILKTLNYFSFTPNFLKWIKCLYNNIESCVMNNGLEE